MNDKNLAAFSKGWLKSMGTEKEGTSRGTSDWNGWIKKDTSRWGLRNTSCLALNPTQGDSTRWFRTPPWCRALFNEQKWCESKKWRVACWAIRRAPKLLIMLTMPQSIRTPGYPWLANGSDPISISPSKKRKRGTYRGEITPVIFFTAAVLSEKRA